MIVIDTNVIAYLLINGDKTSLAQRVLLADSDWHAPILWKSEFRNVLTLYIRHGQMDLDEAHQVMDKAEQLLSGKEHTVPSPLVLSLAARTNVSAYDCEFVALARAVNCGLVSADKKLVAGFPSDAKSMETYVAQFNS